MKSDVRFLFVGFEAPRFWQRVWRAQLWMACGPATFAQAAGRSLLHKQHRSESANENSGQKCDQLVYIYYVSEMFLTFGHILQSRAPEGIPNTKIRNKAFEEASQVLVTLTIRDYIGVALAFAHWELTWSFDMCKDVWAVFWGKLSNCETLAVLLRCVLVVVLERLQLVPGSIVLDWGTGQLCIVMLVESSCFQLACFCSVSPFASTPSYRCVANVNVCFHPCYGASTLAHFSIF